MPDIEVITVGTQGPAGPASVAVGSVVTTRGAIPVGNSAGTPVALLIGPNGQYLRSNGTDLVYAAMLPADLPSAIDAIKIANGQITNTEFQTLDGASSNLQAQLNGKAATAHAHASPATRGWFTESNAQSTATPTDNTASTTVWASAMVANLAVPSAGSWRIQARAALNLKHSNNATSLMRVTIGSNDTTARSVTASSTVWTRTEDTDELIFTFGGVALGFSVTISFRSSDPGTTFAQNPAYTVTGELQ